MPEDRPRPGQEWTERMLREEPLARKRWPAGESFGDGPETDANLFYADLLAGPDETAEDIMAGWTPPPRDEIPPPSVDNPFSLRALRPDTAALADHVGLTVEEFIELFGLEWVANPNPSTRSGDDLVENDPLGWFTQGDPVQIMMRAAHEGLELARPHGRWETSYQLAIVPDDVVRVGLVDGWTDRAEHHVSAILRRRRSTFRYCRYCRNITPPEQRDGRDYCYPCSETIRSVIR